VEYFSGVERGMPKGRKGAFQIIASTVVERIDNRILVVRCRLAIVSFTQTFCG
jgi:hypothetical protein